MLFVGGGGIAGGINNAVLFGWNVQYTDGNGMEVTPIMCNTRACQHIYM